MTLSVRQASNADHAVVVELLAGYLDFYGVCQSRERVRAFVAERLRVGDSVILLAETDGEAIGFCQVYPTLSSLELAPLWTLGDLFVVLASRGTGAGRALVQDVCRRAAAAGAAGVALETAHTNTTAQALYESEGFVRDAVYRVYARTVGG